MKYVEVFRDKRKFYDHLYKVIGLVAMLIGCTFIFSLILYPVYLPSLSTALAYIISSAFSILAFYIAFMYVINKLEINDTYEWQNMYFGILGFVLFSIIFLNALIMDIIEGDLVAILLGGGLAVYVAQFIYRRYRHQDP